MSRRAQSALVAVCFVAAGLFLIADPVLLSGGPVGRDR